MTYSDRVQQLLTKEAMVRLVVVASVALGAGLLAFIVRSSADDVYESEARYALGPSTVLETDNPRDRIEAMRALADAGTVASIAEVMGSGLVVDRAMEAVDPGRDWSDYSVTASEVTSASLVDITTAGPDAEVAAALTDMVGRVGAAEVTEIFVVFEATLVDEASVPGDPISPAPGRDALLVMIAVGALVGVVVLRSELRAVL